MTQTGFPRGGKKPLTKQVRNGLSNRSLFGEKWKEKSSRSRPKKAENKEKDNDAPFIAAEARCLTYTTVKEGMVILGRVHESTQYNVSISFPGHLSGLLKVTEVGGAYTDLLKSLVSSENPPPEFKPLSELYKRGQYVVCYIKHTNALAKPRIAVSVEPECINESLDSGKLVKGSKIVCSVSSVEDHGYVVDTGLKNLRAFLSKTDVDEGTKYYPGQQIFCAVKSAKTTENITTAKLSTKKKHLTSPCSLDGQPLDALAPGTKFTLTIKQILHDGLRVVFNGKNVGYINRLYLQNPLDAYEKGTEITGTLMYVLPIVKFSYFTEIPLEDEEDILPSGKLISATVLYRSAKGIILAFKSGAKGFLPLNRTGVDVDKIPTKFAPGTAINCKILTYDIFDRTHVCTALKHEMVSHSKTAEEVAIGDVLQVEIAQEPKPNGFVFVKSGRILGDVPPEHAADLNEPIDITVGKKMMARVLSKDKTGRRFNFTLKKSLVTSELPILDDFSKAKLGSMYLGTIVKKDGLGLMVKFYGDVMGVVPSKTLDVQTKRFSRVGQVIYVKITKIGSTEQKLYLEIVKPPASDVTLWKVGESVEGTIIDSSEEGIHVRISKPSGDGYDTAFLPAGHMSPCREIGTRLAARCIPGDTIDAHVFSTTPEFVLSRIAVPQEWYTSIKNLKIGDILPCSVTQIDKHGIKVLLPIKDLKSYGIVTLNKLDNIELLSKHQMLFGKITNINKKTEEIYLTTILHDLWSSAVAHGTETVTSVDLLSLYLSKLKELSCQSYYQNKPISSIKLGQRVSAVVERVTKNGLTLKLENDAPGIVRLAHIQEEVKPGDKVVGTVMWVNYVHEVVEITLNRQFKCIIREKQNCIPEDAMGKRLIARILLVNEWFALAVVKGQGKGNLVALPTRIHLNQMQSDIKNYIIGGKVRCQVVLKDAESAILPVCLTKSAFEVVKKIDAIKEEKKEVDGNLEATIKLDCITEASNNKVSVSKNKLAKRKSEKLPVIQENEIPKLKRQKQKEPIEVQSSKFEVSEEKLKTKKAKREREAKAIKSKITEDPEEAAAPKAKKLKKQKTEENTDIASTTPKKPEESKQIVKKPEHPEIEQLSLPECGFFWDTKADTSLLTEESSEDEEEPEDQPKQKKKKLTPAERRELERQKEREIRAKEEALASNEVPNTVDHFDRLVLGSPDSSYIWVQYMAFHLQATEIDKARAVAKRALSTINFREEKEKLNVWQALLNLESRFGTPELLNKTLHDALRACDAMKIYLHMLTVHVDAGRAAEVENTVRTVTAKFKSVPDAWVKCGEALLKVGLKEKSRQTMQRALQSLPDNQHVNLMVKFAQLESQFGDKERATTLYDKIITCYPKRIDVWFIYIDALTKSEDYDAARNVLERAVIQSLPPKKMKSLFEKFLKFEEQHGTPDRVEYVKDITRRYIANQCKS